jgi:hypothetical protein
MFLRENDDRSGAVAREVDFLLALRVSYDETVFEYRILKITLCTFFHKSVVRI